jgi:hypothetical protein
MCRATAAFLTTWLFVALGCVSGAQRAGSTAKSLSPTTQPAALYFPDRFDWQHKKPEEVGMDAARLDEAVKQVIASENPATKDMGLYLATTFGAKSRSTRRLVPSKTAALPTDSSSAMGISLPSGATRGAWT